MYGTRTLFCRTLTSLYDENKLCISYLNQSAQKSALNVAMILENYCILPYAYVICSYNVRTVRRPTLFRKRTYTVVPCRRRKPLRDVSHSALLTITDSIMLQLHDPIIDLLQLNFTPNYVYRVWPLPDTLGINIQPSRRKRRFAAKTRAAALLCQLYILYTLAYKCDRTSATF